MYYFLTLFLRIPVEFCLFPRPSSQDSFSSSCEISDYVDFPTEDAICISPRHLSSAFLDSCTTEISPMWTKGDKRTVVVSFDGKPFHLLEPVLCLGNRAFWGCLELWKQETDSFKEHVLNTCTGHWVPSSLGDSLGLTHCCVPPPWTDPQRGSNAPSSSSPSHPLPGSFIFRPLLNVDVSRSSCWLALVRFFFFLVAVTHHYREKTFILAHGFRAYSLRVARSITLSLRGDKISQWLEQTADEGACLVAKERNRRQGDRDKERGERKETWYRA